MRHDEARESEGLQKRVLLLMYSPLDSRVGLRSHVERLAENQPIRPSDEMLPNDREGIVPLALVPVLGFQEPSKREAKIRIEVRASVMS